MTVNILGTEYTIEYKTDKEIEEISNRSIEECQSCYDPKNRVMFVARGSEEYTKTNLRDAIIHTFGEESGIEKFSTRWMAAQLPKMIKAFKEVGAIEGCGCKCQKQKECSNTTIPKEEIDRLYDAYNRECRKQPNGQEIMDAVIAGKTLAEAAKMHDLKCPEESDLKKACDEVFDNWAQLSEEDKIKYSNSVYAYEQLKTAVAKRKAEKKCDKDLDEFLKD